MLFGENCTRDGSAGDVETAKQVKAYVSSASPFLLNFNGLAAIASTFLGLNPAFLSVVVDVGAGASIGLCT